MNVDISSGPSDATASRVQYTWNVDHDDVQDVEARLGTYVDSDGGGWNDGFEPVPKTGENGFFAEHGEYSEDTRYSQVNQVDQPVNQRWAFTANDTDGSDGNQGHIDWVELTVYYVLQPAISVSPGKGSYTYGQLTVGDSGTKSFTVDNTGDATLSVEPSLTGSDTDQFSITNGASLSLSPGESYTFDVEYAPSGTGTHSADFELSHNGANAGSPWRATLYGEGEPKPKPAISVSPGEGSYTYGQLTVGDSETKSFTVDNTGDATLSVEPSLTGSNTDQFSITNGASLSLNSGESYTFDVEYAPSGTGTHSADFELSHNRLSTPGYRG